MEVNRMIGSRGGSDEKQRQKFDKDVEGRDEVASRDIPEKCGREGRRSLDEKRK